MHKLDGSVPRHKPQKLSVSNITDKLQAFLRYYARTKGVGHTSALMNGVRNHPAIVIAHNHSHALFLKRLGVHPRARITADIATPLEGVRLPLAFDNHTLEQLFGEIVQHVDFVEAALSEQTQIVATLQQTCRSYESRIKRFQTLSKKRRARKN